MLTQQRWDQLVHFYEVVKPRWDAEVAKIMERDRMNDRPLTERERIVLRKALDAFAYTTLENFNRGGNQQVQAGDRQIARDLSLRLT